MSDSPKAPFWLGVALGTVWFIPSFICVVLLGIFESKVIVDLWRWFAAPMFSLPALPLAGTYGCLLLAIAGVTAVRGGSTTKTDPETSVFRLWGTQLLRFSLLCFLVHHYGLPWPFSKFA